MFSKSKIALIVAVAATFAAPAFAQSVDHTGTLSPSYYDGNGKQVVGSWAPQAKASHLGQATQTRALYNSAVVPAAPQAAPSGYDASIATQR